MSADVQSSPDWLRRAGLWTGLLGGILVILLAGPIADLGTQAVGVLAERRLLNLSEGLTVTAAAVRVLGVTFWVGCWWVTEPISLGATALLPMVLFPVLGIAKASVVAPAYMSAFVMLLLGGFLLALAVEKSGVHRRLALHVLLLVGTSPRRLVLGFGIAAAALSMGISNTATTLIMMPIALALLERARDDDVVAAKQFGIAVLLGIAYSASVGGMGTPVGTPPNTIGIKAIEQNGGASLSFVDWMGNALPVVLLLIPLIWLALTRIYPRVPASLSFGAKTVLQDQLEGMGKWRAHEIRALALFGLAAFLWVTRRPVEAGQWFAFSGWEMPLGLSKYTHDSTVAIGVAVLGFLVPVAKGSQDRLLTWSVAKNAPWDLVLLFGGGVALSKGFESTGLSTLMGTFVGSISSDRAVLLVVVLAFVVFATEIMSNTALSNIAMPILGFSAVQAGFTPETLVVPAALASSAAFMMPAATGPNAIVFGTGQIRIPEMVRAGFLINLLAILVLWGIFVFR